MLSRNTCGTCTQCFQEHDDAKTEKLKMRRINVTEEARDYTKDSKIWIPAERKYEMIENTHILLAHAGAEKVTKYICRYF